MSKEERIQRLLELRRQIFTKLNDMSIVPKEVEKIKKDALVELSEIYEAQRVSTDSIVSYIDGAFNEMNTNISTRSENDRRGIYWEQIEKLFNKLEGKILNDEELSKTDINGFEINDDKRDSTLNCIIDMITESLNDIQSRQRKLMEERGFSDEQIKTQNDMVREFIRDFKMNKAGEIAAFYEKREKDLEDEILEKVTEFINEMKSLKQGSENSLIDDLRVDGLTYEQQSANAANFTQNFKNGEQGRKEGLPTDLLR